VFPFVLRYFSSLLSNYIKDSAHRSNPRNLDELNANMSNMTADISPMALQAVYGQAPPRSVMHATSWGTLLKLFVTKSIVRLALYEVLV
jgi:hypothetical protein